MNFKAIKTARTASFLLFATFVNPLMAQTTTDYSAGWYLGGNIGLSLGNIDEEKITRHIPDFYYTDDFGDLGYKLYGGYQLNKYFALEGGYFNLGKFSYTLSAPSGTLDGNIEVMGGNLDAVAILPITEDFSAFGRVGANYAQAKDSFSATGSISVADKNPKKDDFNYKFGFGLQYAITDAIGMRIEAERYRIDDAIGNDGDVDLFSIGLSYRFGVAKKVVTLANQKEVITPAFREEKVLIVVNEPAAQEKIEKAVIQEHTVVLTLKNINFEFDESTLNQEAKDALKRYIPLLNKNPKARVNLEGHTSRMGTEEYNQELSVRRAQSVKDYLVKENLFSEDKISIVGYGETMPAEYEINENNIRSEAARANMRVILEVTQK